MQFVLNAVINFLHHHFHTHSHILFLSGSIWRFCLVSSSVRAAFLWGIRCCWYRLRIRLCVTSYVSSFFYDKPMCRYGYLYDSVLKKIYFFLLLDVTLYWASKKTCILWSSTNCWRVKMKYNLSQWSVHLNWSYCGPNLVILEINTPHGGNKNETSLSLLTMDEVERSVQQTIA